MTKKFTQFLYDLNMKNKSEISSRAGEVAANGSKKVLFSTDLSDAESAANGLIDEVWNEESVTDDAILFDNYEDSSASSLITELELLDLDGKYDEECFTFVGDDTGFGLSKK